MNTIRAFLDLEGERSLLQLIGRSMFWVFGPAFIIENDLIVSRQFVFPLGPDPSAGDIGYLVIGSDRYESPSKDYLDYGSFSLSLADSLSAALGRSGALLTDMSSIVVPEDNVVTRVRVTMAHVAGQDDEVLYDALIHIDLSDGRTLSIGHAPGVYEGVCATFGRPSTLGDPKDLSDRVSIP